MTDPSNDSFEKKIWALIRSALPHGARISENDCTRLARKLMREAVITEQELETELGTPIVLTDLVVPDTLRQHQVTRDGSPNANISVKQMYEKQTVEASRSPTHLIIYTPEMTLACPICYADDLTPGTNHFTRENKTCDFMQFHKMFVGCELYNREMAAAYLDEIQRNPDTEKKLPAKIVMNPAVYNYMRANGMSADVIKRAPKNWNPTHEHHITTGVFGAGSRWSFIRAYNEVPQIYKVETDRVQTVDDPRNFQRDARRDGLFHFYFRRLVREGARHRQNAEVYCKETEAYIAMEEENKRNARQLKKATDRIEDLCAKDLPRELQRANRDTEKLQEKYDDLKQDYKDLKHDHDKLYDKHYYRTLVPRKRAREGNDDADSDDGDSASSAQQGDTREADAKKLVEENNALQEELQKAKEEIETAKQDNEKLRSDLTAHAKYETSASEAMALVNQLLAQLDDLNDLNLDENGQGVISQTKALKRQIRGHADKMNQARQVVTPAPP